MGRETKSYADHGPAVSDEAGEILEYYRHDRAAIFEHLYGCLSIIDQKSSSLLTFNAIGLASLAVWLGYVPLNWLHFSLDIIFLLFLVSCCLCLLVVTLHWSSVAELRDLRQQTETLLAKRDSRTAQYRRALCISSLCVVLLVVVSSVHAVGTLLMASDNCPPSCQEFYGRESWGIDYRPEPGSQ